MGKADFFPIRGVIEGFYGKPWTHEERLDMLAFLGRHGFNSYFYAPKDDPFLRENWSELHPEAELTRLAGLLVHARHAGLRFCYCLSPGLSIKYAQPLHQEQLIQKCRQLFDLGVRSFALLFDDIPEVLMHPEDRAAFASLAEAHAHTIGQVQDALMAWSSDCELVVCPTLYHGVGTEPYVTDLGKRVPKEIPLFWTGRFVCSPMLTERDSRLFVEATGHRPLYWDNYPVNDLAMAEELHIGPLRHREPDLYRHAAGFVANAMQYAEASKIALATIGEYVNDPEGYEPEAAWSRAVREILGEDDAERFLQFADNVRTSCLSDIESPRLLAALQEFRFEYLYGDRMKAVNGLQSVFVEMEKNADALLTGLQNDKLKQEIRPWLVKYWHWAKTGRLTAQLIAAGDEGRFIQAATLYIQLRRWMNRTKRLAQKVCGNVMEMFVEMVLAEAAKRRR